MYLRLTLPRRGVVRRAVGRFALTICCASLLAGCGSLTPAENVAVGAVTATVVGGQAPSHEIEQTYYIGVFDPQEQLPPQMYRIRINGQSSFISATRFASGWVPAALVDSLGAGVRLDPKGGSIAIEKAKDEEIAQLKPGRRLIMFGPEGFREAPADYRLVVVMGSSPEDFFNAIDQTLGTVAKTIDEQRSGRLQNEVLRTLVRIQGERQRLSDLRADIAEDKLRLAGDGQ